MEYDPQARCDAYELFISRILGHDSALISYVQRVIGYSLTGLVSEKALFCFSATETTAKLPCWKSCGTFSAIMPGKS